MNKINILVKSERIILSNILKGVMYVYIFITKS